MTGILTLVTLFQYIIGLIIAHYFGWDESTVLRIIAVMCLAFSVIEFVFSYNRMMLKTKKAFRRFFALFIFILLSSIPVILIYKDFSVVSGEIMAFGTRCFSGLLMAFWLTAEKFERKVYKWISPIAILITILLLIVVIQNRENAGFANASMLMSINRQSVAYGAAYSFGLILFTKTIGKTIYGFKLFNGRIFGFLSWAALLLDIYIVFSAEGKGAFVLVACCFLLFVFLSVSIKGFTASMILKGSCLVLIVFFASTLLIHFISPGNNIIQMIRSGFSDRSSSERLNLYSHAFSAAKDRLFFGTGATTVIYDVGFYSHNIFIDILCDFGIIGLIITTGLLINAISSSYKGRRNPFVRFITYVFFFGFIMLLFSGSWMSDPLIWFGLPALISSKCFISNRLFQNGERRALVNYG